MLVYEAVELGLSHNCAGTVFGVRSVPRIVRRIKIRLARLTPEMQKITLASQHVGVARIDALLAISNARDANLIAPRHFMRLDFRIDSEVTKLCKHLAPDTRTPLAIAIRRKAR